MMRCSVGPSFLDEVRDDRDRLSARVAALDAHRPARSSAPERARSRSTW
jgi:hypothetical protein